MMTCNSCGKPIPERNGISGICRHCTMAHLLDVSEMGESRSQTTDDYDIERELGRGGDGIVYLGRDRNVGRQVAIKLLNTTLSEDGVTERRFRAEAEAIARLDHPNIIPIYANGEMDGRPFYTMKFVGGGSLATQMQVFSRPRTAVVLLIKLSRAIHHAHERCILHRDLKPSNILLDASLEPYISDFGLAKRFDQTLELTLTGTVMGTPSYMSPEQARGDNAQITTTSDVFSLGSIFYQLLTGRLPFEGASTHTVLQHVIESQVQFPKERSERIDRDLETVCMKCLEKAPERRYASALALAEDLERWERDEPVLARRASSLERGMRWIQRHPLTAGALGLAIFSLLTGFIVSLALWQNAEKAREAAETNAYFANIANAVSAREKFDYGEARRLLATAPEERRGFEWYLLRGLSRGDQHWATSLGPSLPITLTRDQGGDRILLLKEDRTYHTVDWEAGSLTPAGKIPLLPEAFRGPSDLGLRGFHFAPDGEHYAVLDGDHLLVASRRDELIFAGPTHKGASACWLDSERVVEAARSIDSVVEIRPGIFGDSASLYDLRTGLQDKLPPLGWAGPIARSPDGSRIAIVSRNFGIAVLDLNRGFTAPPLQTLSDDRGPVGSVLFSPDGRYLGASWLGSPVAYKILDLQTGQTVFEQDWPTVAALSFASNNASLLIAGRQSWFTQWHFHFHAHRHSAATFNDGHAHSTTFGRGGPFTPPESLLTRSTSNHLTSFFFGHAAPVTSILSLPDMKGHLTAGQDGTLRLWPAYPSMQQRNALVATNHYFHHPVASQNGDYCAYLNQKRYSEVWHRPSGRTLALPRDQVYLAVFNDGRILSRMVDSGDILCSRWAPDGSTQQLWRHHPGRTNQGGSHFIHSAVTPDERHLSVLQPGRLLTVDMDSQTGRTLPNQVMRHGSRPGQSTAISPDGKLAVVTGFKGPYARLYQTATPDAGHHELLSQKPHRTRDSACGFSADGTRIFVGNNDGWVRVFDTVTLKEIPSESWLAHSSEVTALAISQRGDVVATAGGKATTLWSTRKHPDRPRRQRLHIETGPASRNWIQFCADDTLLLHAGAGMPIEVWTTERTTGWKKLHSGDGESVSGQRVTVAPKHTLSSATTSQSSSYQNDNQFPASSATDGNLHTFTATASAEKQPWWQVEFDEELPVDNVVLHNRVDCCGDRLSDLTVTVYRSTGDVLYQSEILNPSNALEDPVTLTVNLPGAPLAKRIRISRNAAHQAGDATILSLGEVEVFDTPVPR